MPAPLKSAEKPSKWIPQTPSISKPLIWVLSKCEMIKKIMLDDDFEVLEILFSSTFGFYKHNIY